MSESRGEIISVRRGDFIGIRILVDWPAGAGRPTYRKLMGMAGMEESTFERARVEAVKVREWLVGGGKAGYQLNPDGRWKEALVEVPVPSGSPSTSPSGIAFTSTPL